jgi:hypothetical protein
VEGILSDGGDNVVRETWTNCRMSYAEEYPLESAEEGMASSVRMTAYSPRMSLLEL